MKKLIIFGAGYHGRAAIRKCNNTKNIECSIVIDNDKKKHNKLLLRKKIYHPESIDYKKYDKVVLCGRYINEQFKQIRKYNFDKKNILIWGRKELLPEKKNIEKREKILIKILKFITKKFEQKNIRYWVDYSGLLALMRKQNLAELSDVDISIDIKDLKKVTTIIKKNDGLFKLYLQTFYNKILKKKHPKIYIHGKTNLNLLEPPTIDFVLKKFNKRLASNIADKSTYLIKYWNSFNTIGYKGLTFRIPDYTEEYLTKVYGRLWKKKPQTWSIKNKK
jgi:hypothetical protein